MKKMNSFILFFLTFFYANYSQAVLGYQETTEAIEQVTKKLDQSSWIYDKVVADDGVTEHWFKYRESFREANGYTNPRDIQFVLFPRQPLRGAMPDGLAYDIAVKGENNATGQANAKIAKLVQLSLMRAKIKIGPSGFQRTANVYEVQKATIYMKNAADLRRMMKAIESVVEEANSEGIDQVIKKLKKI
jgi:hypothetical protein